MTLRGKTLKASGFHAPHRGVIDVLDQALIALDDAGSIRSITRRGEPTYATEERLAREAGLLETLDAGCFLIPGFVDLHVHAPQYPQLGAALDEPLEVWLHRYTFPLEARYIDLAFARRAYASLVTDLIANGTTTALYFATIHQEATRLLVDLCLEKGQRALIGKVAMDHPDLCPEDYRDASASAAIEGTAALIDYVQSHPGNREGKVLPVVTPRFIPSCTDPLLEELGALAQACDCHVQTHVSESDWQHGFVRERYGMSDTFSLDRFGLLGQRTVLAHAPFLSAADMEQIRQRGTGIAHCPHSNAYFAGAIFPLRAALEKGLRVGLGTDISGGPSGSLLDAQRQAIAQSRWLESGVDPDLPAKSRSSRGASRIDFRDAFFLATAGGGDALRLPVGRFVEGASFDALVIDPAAPHGSLRLYDELDRGEGILQKTIYTANERNIAEVFVAGVPIKQPSD